MAYTKNGDFRKYYCTTIKRSYWLLGYFGGGSINIVNAYQLAKEYAQSTGVPLETVVIDEILSSRRYKGYKIIYSTQKHEKELDTNWESENIYAYLRE